MIRPSIRPWVGIARLRDIAALIALMLVGLAVSAAHATPITIDMVTVGNPGNGTDTSGRPDTAGFGRVDYSYQIGTYSVTIGQYTAFLNAADPNGANPNGTVLP